VNEHRTTTASPVMEGMLTPVCAHCDRRIKSVPGGDGPVWVHIDGFRACNHRERLNPEQVRARELVTGVLAQADAVLPFVSEFLDGLRMDTPQDQAVVDELAGNLRPLVADVLELRALSHRNHQTGDPT
jgi:hypothetical protein